MYFPKQNSVTHFVEGAEKAHIYSVIMACFFLVALENVIGFIVLMRCKRLPLQIRILAMNMTVPDFIFGTAGGIVYGIRLWQEHLPFLDRVCRCIFESLTTLSVLNITVFSVDRLLNLEFAMKYQIFVTKSKMICTCCCLWVFSIGSASLMQYLGPDTDGKLFKIVLRSVFLLTFSFANMKIFRISQKHNRNVSDLNSMTASRIFMNQVVLANKVIFITGPHFILFLLDIGVDITLYCKQEMLQEYVWELFLVFINIASSLITPLMYIWRFRECQIQFLLLVSVCNSKYREKLLAERNRLYEPFLEPDFEQITRMKNRMKLNLNNKTYEE